MFFLYSPKMESETQTEIMPLEPPPASAAPPPTVVTPQVQRQPRPHSSRYTPIPQLSVQERRSSKRSIKRKRFDDEVVESSLLKQEAPRKIKGKVKILID